MGWKLLLRCLQMQLSLMLENKNNKNNENNEKIRNKCSYREIEKNPEN